MELRTRLSGYGKANLFWIAFGFMVIWLFLSGNPNSPMPFLTASLIIVIGWVWLFGGKKK